MNQKTYFHLKIKGENQGRYLSQVPLCYTALTLSFLILYYKITQTNRLQIIFISTPIPNLAQNTNKHSSNYYPYQSNEIISESQLVSKNGHDK